MLTTPSSPDGATGWEAWRDRAEAEPGISCRWLWLGRRQAVGPALDSVGLWVPAAQAAGVWARDIDHAREVIARRGGRVLGTAAVWQVCAHWPWHLHESEQPITAAQSPLGGVLLLPDPDETREVGRGVEHRWLAVRPLKRPPNQPKKLS